MIRPPLVFMNENHGISIKLYFDHFTCICIYFHFIFWTLCRYNINFINQTSMLTFKLSFNDLPWHLFTRNPDCFFHRYLSMHLLILWRISHLLVTLISISLIPLLVLLLRMIGVIMPIRPFSFIYYSNRFHNYRYVLLYACAYKGSIGISFKIADPITHYWSSAEAAATPY